MSMIATKTYQNRQEEFTDDYQIEYVRESDGAISMFVLEHPENNFDSSVSKCHLYSNNKICVQEGKEPRSFEIAEAIAFYWMMRYSEYVRTGQFRDTGGRINV